MHSSPHYTYSKCPLIIRERVEVKGEEVKKRKWEREIWGGGGGGGGKCLCMSLPLLYNVPHGQKITFK